MDDIIDLKPIPGFSKYQVSDNGIVINSYGRRLSPYPDASGYQWVGLINDAGVRKNVSLHRAVALTWIGPIPKGYWVNHENGNKADNHVNNLRIDTPQYNHLHASRVLNRHYAKGERSAMSRLNPEAIKAVFELRRLGWSQRRIAQAIGVSQPTINSVLHGRTWKSEREESTIVPQS